MTLLFVDVHLHLSLLSLCFYFRFHFFYYRAVTIQTVFLFHRKIAKLEYERIRDKIALRIIEMCMHMSRDEPTYTLCITV